MSSDIAGALPADLPDALKEATAAVTRAFLDACMADPLFQFDLLVLGFPPASPRPAPADLGHAARWTGRSGKVRAVPVEPGLPLAAFSAARPDNAQWNVAWWLAGLKPDGSGVVMRVLTEMVQDPGQLLRDGNWAMARIANLHEDLRARGR